MSTRICKKCGEVLNDNETVCPSCGTPWETIQTENEPLEVEEDDNHITSDEEKSPQEDHDEEEKHPLNKKKLGLVICAAILVVAITIGIIFMVTEGAKNADVEPSGTTIATPTDLNGEAAAPTVAQPTPEELTAHPVLARDAYTTEETSKLDEIAVTMGEYSLTNRQLSIWFWQSYYDLMKNMGNMMPMYGMDPTKPLDSQICGMTDVSMYWEQFLLEKSIQNWQSYAALYAEAEAAGMTITEEEQKSLDDLEQSLAETAQQHGYESAEDMIQRDFGVTVSIQDYKEFVKTMILGNQYFRFIVDGVTPSDEDVNSFYQENEEGLNAQGIVRDGRPSQISVRHILVQPDEEPAGENGAYSQEQMDAAQDKAQEILDAWEAGEATEDSFAALAEEKTMDPGSKSNGGLYENVVLGQMVKPFEDWCFDADRIYGDTGLVQTDYGVHVMFFVSASEEENWFVQTKNLMTDQETQKSMAEIVQNHSVEVDYRNLYIASIPAPGEE